MIFDTNAIEQTRGKKTFFSDGKSRGPLLARWHLIFTLIPQFVTSFFISVLVVIFLNVLTDFSANIFLTLSRLQTIYFLFSDPENNFFNGFHTCPSKKNNGPYAGIEELFKITTLRC